MTTVSTKMLMWDPKSRMFACEASDLHDCGPRMTHIVLVSHKTGAKRTFVIDRVNRDREGEICSWVFVCADLKLVIFND